MFMLLYVRDRCIGITKLYVEEKVLSGKQVGFSAALHRLHWPELGSYVLQEPLLRKQLVTLIRVSAFADGQVCDCILFD